MQTMLELPRVLSLVRASWQAAVLILLVLAAQWAFGRRLAPRWRYALWLLVILRLAVPFTVPSSVSVFNVLRLPQGATPALVTRTEPALSAVNREPPRTVIPAEGSVLGGMPTISATPATARWPLSWLLPNWAIGAMTLGSYLAWSHYRILRQVLVCRPLIEAPVMNLLEDCKERMGVHTPVTLVETTQAGSPALFGFIRPRLLLPVGLTRRFSPEELRFIFLHELGHLKRHDIFIAWLMTGLQIVHWFNPLVWLAFHRMRVDRELACDALALSYARENDNQPYGRTIIKLLEGFGSSAWAPGLAGTVENRNQLKERIGMIAKFNKTNRGPVLAIALMAGLGLITFTDARPGGGISAQAADAPLPPRIISTFPAVGAINVDVVVAQIEVTFDQDMGGGMSWTGGGTDFPASPEGQKAQWRDQRTCVLPVKLEAGHYYRVGINSTSFRNFRSVAGVSAIPTAIYFTTQGATAELNDQMNAPQVIATSPAIGATDVYPALTEITVTFDQDMGGGMSWTGGGPEFPAAPEGQKAQWRDQRTCVLPVKLEEGHYYRVGINSTSYQNFANAHGVAALPSAIFFTTLGANDDLKAKVRLPKIVSMDPPNAAQGVNAALTQLQVTFDVPMGGGFSWTGGGPTFPKGPEGKRPYWSEDRLTCVLPVELAPGMTYKIGLNSPWHKNFQSAAGVPLVPVDYTFTTAK